jgi:hypothetical protein
MPADKTGGVVPIGMTTTLSADELTRIRTTLLHAEAKTQGQTIMSEVRLKSNVGQGNDSLYAI